MVQENHTRSQKKAQGEMKDREQQTPTKAKNQTCLQFQPFIISSFSLASIFLLLASASNLTSRLLASSISESDSLDEDCSCTHQKKTMPLVLTAANSSREIKRLRNLPLNSAEKVVHKMRKKKVRTGCLCDFYVMDISTPIWKKKRRTKGKKTDAIRLTPHDFHQFIVNHAS